MPPNRLDLAIFAAAIAVLGGTAACEAAPDAPDRGSDAASATNGALVRDSAGVRIIENRTPQWGDTPAWLVEEEPVLTLGVVGGDPDYEFVRVMDATRLDDGTIVVADGYRVRFYDPEGRHLATAGRQGQGPGEFPDRVGFLCRLPDGTVAAANNFRLHYNVFTVEGGLVQAVAEGGIGPQTGRFGCFGDGTWLASRVQLSHPRPDPNNPVMRRWFEHYRVEGERAVSAPIATHDISPIWDRGRGASPVSVPFTGESSAAAGGDRLVVWRAELGRIEVRTSQGELHTLIEALLPLRVSEIWEEYVADLSSGGGRAGTPVVPWEFSAADIDSVGRRAVVRGTPASPPIPRAQEPSEELLAMLALGPDGLHLPEWVPIWTEIHVDPLGYIWAERTRGTTLRDIALSHDVFDPEGRWLGTLDLTSDAFSRILEIGEDYILTGYVDRADWGVHKVRLHRILGR